MKAEDRLQLMRQDLDYVHTGLRDLESNAMRFYQETSQHEMVKAFKKKFGVVMPDAPTFDEVPGGTTWNLRVALIDEELNELRSAINDRDMTEVVDAIADLLYVVHGAALDAGIQHIQPFFEEVHKTNMAKMKYSKAAADKAEAAGKKVPIGKILKPEGWQPPRIAELLEEHYGA